MSIKIESVPDMPDFDHPGRWAELYAAAENMAVGQVIRVLLENKNAVKSAQASLQGTHGSSAHRKANLRAKGFRFVTRTRPVNGKSDGEWYLYVKRTA